MISSPGASKSTDIGPQSENRARVAEAGQGACPAVFCAFFGVRFDVARSSVNLHRLKLIRDAVDDRGDTGEKRVDESLLVRATMFRTGRNVEEFCTGDRGLA